MSTAAVLGRRNTINDVESTNPLVHSIFGRWPLQFNHPNFGLLSEIIIKAKTRTYFKPQPKKPAEKEFCALNGKRIYSEAGARRALIWALNIGNAYAPRRMYPCDHCKRYHLTSIV